MLNHAQLPDSGRTPHRDIDRNLPTDAQKTVLHDFDANIFPFATSDANTANPPTDAQLDSAFGTPATVGEGFFAILDDAGAGVNVYLCYSDGTAWWQGALTKAL